ncbi:NADH-FMN oxidoreductase RutF, flavin reductase (DIM6/NTAB) family [Saccharopolyspora kobensis]|uniref:3-hydroxy-9,10-secoandrosta-1,3,5(10)-triene-9,17-dione monooxygenase reductase component n=1 Tax=Saccharopolyspora kobensis TaxID=146035 RepID=A0A1H6DUB2_9PSEU|nr:flavin reductase family protein [Saccharopolyspora kobensis]SEG88286.1 NADH-FMN oxidoreductase RutF, flavin reductase (DIM6/NTAB) family [Saccharopolyspora kobensis]SFE01999.1 3-hydroxy-9,10-secoandrosta-1,3,5(10)-triene-9,17-dione monooxygenase reductase component [Saccharopolyspora kobensis]
MTVTAQVDVRIPLDSKAFRRAMGLFPTGVALITRGSGAEAEVITANSVVSVSLDPIMVLVGVRADGRIRPRIDAAGSFAINVLSAEQQELSATFGRRERPRGRDAARLLGGAVDGAGNVLVDGAVFGLECRVDVAHRAGDHVLFLARVVAVHMGEADKSPLVFHRGGYASVA